MPLPPRVSEARAKAVPPPGPREAPGDRTRRRRAADFAASAAPDALSIKPLTLRGFGRTSSSREDPAPAKPRRGSRFLVPWLAAAGSLLAASGCDMGSNGRLARRLLEDHRRLNHARPLPSAQVVELTLSAPESGASGSLRIEWDFHNYRETFASAGATTVRGTQGEKGYFTDMDGVTRVISEPILAQLVTRSYFWRRGYLFDDAEWAKLELGPADPERVSIRLTPHAGNPLLLTFARRGLRLVAASSPDLAIDFESEDRWIDRSWTGASVHVAHRRTGLPTGTLADAVVGGWSAVWPPSSSSVDAPLAASSESMVAVRGSIGGADALIAVDSSVTCPVRIRPALAERMRLSPAPDVLGRRIASGVRVAIGDWSEPSVHVEVSEDLPEGADAALGGTLLREAIVEYDAPFGRLRLHDPARWVRPEGYYRCVLDDDGDRPVAILKRRAATLRVTAGKTAVRALTLAVEAAARAGISPESRSASDLHWGPLALPPLDLVPVPSGFDPAAGDDGALSSRFLLRFRAVLDMTHRWAYLKPESGPKGD